MKHRTNTTKLEQAILAAYALGWADHGAVASDVHAGRVEASAADLAAAPAIDADDLRQRIAEAR